jgi:hypothetical protein
VYRIVFFINQTQFLKTLTLLLALGIAPFSFAQKTKPATFSIDKGVVLIGGGIASYNNQARRTDINDNEQKSKGFNFAPSIGWAVKKNTIVGLYLEYGNSSSKNSISSIIVNENKTNNYGGGLFLRNYKSLGSNFYLLGQTSLGMSVAKTSSENAGASNNRKEEYKTLRLSFAPGVAYSISRTFQVELLFGNMLSGSYGSTVFTSTVSPEKTKQNGFDFTINTAPLLNLSVGFRIFLHSKK